MRFLRIFNFWLEYQNGKSPGINTEVCREYEYLTNIFYQTRGKKDYKKAKKYYNLHSELYAHGYMLPMKK
jgi:hypothetical protein